MIAQRRQKQSEAEKRRAYNQATARAGGVCELCGERPGQRHHRQGRDPFNTVPSNLLLACFLCHAAIHAQPLKSLDLGHIVPGWARPSEYPLFIGGRWVLRSDEEDREIDVFEADRRIDADWTGVSVASTGGQG